MHDAIAGPTESLRHTHTHVLSCAGAPPGEASKTREASRARLAVDQDRYMTVRITINKFVERFIVSVTECLI